MLSKSCSRETGASSLWTSLPVTHFPLGIKTVEKPHTQRAPDVTRRYSNKKAFFFSFFTKNQRTWHFFPVAKEPVSPLVIFPGHTRKKYIKQQNASDNICMFPLLQKEIRTQANEFKHLFKQKLQTTPPFNLSKKRRQTSFQPECQSRQKLCSTITTQ